MKNLKVAVNIVAARFLEEKTKFENSKSDVAKFSYQRRAQMLLDALNILNLFVEPVDVVSDETDN